ncbi:hypothetical protein FDP22_00880 [Paroceanicella profunda]|uniref:Uncharacterized protein n=1 Tax=Paroceanicella profunda TaxID=2579971 RepID=A0A5B8FVU6_9RHOB|nr:hypothetical protein [Paroceanicella profunda]QDL90472.1 hypothetical protein FDP22_00880 [Paroceanicella profunda]
MKSGPFIKLVADTYCVEEKTAKTVARFLKEAGMLTSGARGVNAPDMTARDLGRMTIALLGSDRPGRAVETVTAFGGLTPDPELSTLSQTDINPDADSWPSLDEVMEIYFSGAISRLASVKSLELRPHNMTAEIEFFADDNGAAPRIVFTLAAPTREELDRAYEQISDHRGIRVSRSLHAADMAILIPAIQEA